MRSPALCFELSTRSISKKGNRCGRIRWISLISSVVPWPPAVLQVRNEWYRSFCFLVKTEERRRLYCTARLQTLAERIALPEKASKTALGEAVPQGEMSKRLSYFRNAKSRLFRPYANWWRLNHLVTTKEAVDRLGTMLAGRLRRLADMRSFIIITECQTSAITCKSISRALAEESQCCCWGTSIPCIR